MAPTADHDAPSLRVRDLGLVVIERDGDDSVLSGKAAQAVAMLVSRFPEAVSRQVLLDELWGEDASGDLANNLRVLVHRIRQVLGSADVLTFAAESYRLVVPPTAIDSIVFERLVGQARNHVADGQATAAVRVLDQALGLWRGETAGADPSPELHSWQTHLETLRLDAEEDRILAILNSGDHATAAIDGRRLTDEQPYRERRWELLMLALYRSGRQQEALDTASQATRRLRDDLGVQPRPSLRQLELDILEHAEHLEAKGQSQSELPLLPALAGGPIVGRVDELALVHERCIDHQIVTIAGPGGIGKTSLALSVAHALAGDVAQEREVWWCDLSGMRAAPYGESDRQSSEVARRVGVAAGVRSGSDRIADIAQILSHRSAVTLIIDTCEHVLADVRVVVQGLCAASNVTVLTTSRLPLDVAGESVVRLGPLESDPAGLLFERVARAAAPGLDTFEPDEVERICQRLDGMPLAIELVARRVRSFSLQEIHDHLNTLLHDGQPHSAQLERHATLTSALAWSIEHLSADARVGAGSASVFPGSFELAAFEALLHDRVATSPLLLLEELVVHGLLQVIRTVGHSRYRMLQPVRQHAAIHLVSEPSLDRDRHLDYYLARLETAYAAQGSTGSRLLAEMILHEMHNLAGVHEWALESERFEDDLRLYRPLNTAHLYDRPEPFLWARETVEMGSATGSGRYPDALHAAWYGALAVQLDVQAASQLVTQLQAVGPESPSADLARLAAALHALIVNRDYDTAEAHFGAVSLDDPYVRYVTASVGALVRLTEAGRTGIDAAPAIAVASASLEQSLTWARAIQATNFEAGLLEQQAQVVLAAGELDRARELATTAQAQAATLGMGHIQAQAQFQLVRCDLMERRGEPHVAHRLADTLERAVHASAQARLRWQLPVAAQVFLAHNANDLAALCIGASGFEVGASRAAHALTKHELQAGAELASERNLLDVASLAVQELRALS